MAAGAGGVNQGYVEALALAAEGAEHALQHAFGDGQVGDAVERGAGAGVCDGAGLRLDGVDVGGMLGEEEREEADAAIAVERPIATAEAQRLQRLLHEDGGLGGVDLEEGAGGDAEGAVEHALVDEVLADDDTPAAAGHAEDDDADEAGYGLKQRLAQGIRAAGDIYRTAGAGLDGEQAGRATDALRLDGAGDAGGRG